MQFTGRSLPVHQSMSVLWEFFFTSSHFVSQFPPTRFPLITAIRMCHFLSVRHLGMAFLAGLKAKIQQMHTPLISRINESPSDAVSYYNQNIQLQKQKCVKDI